MLGFWALHENSREFVVRRERQVFICSLDHADAEVLVLFCGSTPASLLVYRELCPELLRYLVFVEPALGVEVGQRRGGAL